MNTKYSFGNINIDCHVSIENENLVNTQNQSANISKYVAFENNIFSEPNIKNNKMNCNDKNAEMYNNTCNILHNKSVQNELNAQNELNTQNVNHMNNATREFYYNQLNNKRQGIQNKRLDVHLPKSVNYENSNMKKFETDIDFTKCTMYKDMYIGQCNKKKNARIMNIATYNNYTNFNDNIVSSSGISNFIKNSTDKEPMNGSKHQNISAEDNHNYCTREKEGNNHFSFYNVKKNYSNEEIYSTHLPNENINKILENTSNHTLGINFNGSNRTENKMIEMRNTYCNKESVASDEFNFSHFCKSKSNIETTYKNGRIKQIRGPDTHENRSNNNYLVETADYKINENIIHNMDVLPSEKGQILEKKFCTILNCHNEIDNCTAKCGYNEMNSLLQNNIIYNNIINNNIINNNIINNNIINNNITNNSITNNSITNNSITTNSITNNSITNNSITNNSITNNSITNNSITNNSITNNSITYNSITNNHFIQCFNKQINKNLNSNILNQCISNVNKGIIYPEEYKKNIPYYIDNCRADYLMNNNVERRKHISSENDRGELHSSNICRIINKGINENLSTNEEFSVVSNIRRSMSKEFDERNLNYRNKLSFLECFENVKNYLNTENCEKFLINKLNLSNEEHASDINNSSCMVIPFHRNCINNNLVHTSSHCFINSENMYIDSKKQIAKKKGNNEIKNRDTPFLKSSEVSNSEKLSNLYKLNCDNVDDSRKITSSTKLDMQNGVCVLTNRNTINNEEQNENEIVKQSINRNHRNFNPDNNQGMPNLISNINDKKENHMLCSYIEPVSVNQVGNNEKAKKSCNSANNTSRITQVDEYRRRIPHPLNNIHIDHVNKCNEQINHKFNLGNVYREEHVNNNNGRGENNTIKECKKKKKNIIQSNYVSHYGASKGKNNVNINQWNEVISMNNNYIIMSNSCENNGSSCYKEEVHEKICKTHEVNSNEEMQTLRKLTSTNLSNMNMFTKYPMKEEAGNIKKEICHQKVMEKDVSSDNSELICSHGASAEDATTYSNIQMNNNLWKCRIGNNEQIVKNEELTILKNIPKLRMVWETKGSFTFDTVSNNNCKKCKTYEICGSFYKPHEMHDEVGFCTFYFPEKLPERPLINEVEKKKEGIFEKKKFLKVDKSNNRINKTMGNISIVMKNESSNLSAVSEMENKEKKKKNSTYPLCRTVSLEGSHNNRKKIHQKIIGNNYFCIVGEEKTNHDNFVDHFKNLQEKKIHDHCFMHVKNGNRREINDRMNVINNSHFIDSRKTSIIVNSSNSTLGDRCYPRNQQEIEERKGLPGELDFMNHISDKAEEFIRKDGSKVLSNDCDTLNGALNIAMVEHIERNKEFDNKENKLKDDNGSEYLVTDELLIHEGDASLRKVIFRHDSDSNGSNRSNNSSGNSSGNRSSNSRSNNAHNNKKDNNNAGIIIDNTNEGKMKKKENNLGAPCDRSNADKNNGQSIDNITIYDNQRIYNNVFITHNDISSTYNNSVTAGEVNLSDTPGILLEQGVNRRISPNNNGDANFNNNGDANVNSNGDANFNNNGDANFNNNGDANVNSNGDANFNSSGDVNLDSSGDVNLDSSGNANLNSNYNYTICNNRSVCFNCSRKVAVDTCCKLSEECISSTFNGINNPRNYVCSHVLGNGRDINKNNDDHNIFLHTIEGNFEGKVSSCKGEFSTASSSCSTHDNYENNHEDFSKSYNVSPWRNISKGNYFRNASNFDTINGISSVSTASNMNNISSVSTASNMNNISSVSTASNMNCVNGGSNLNPPYFIRISPQTDKINVVEKQANDYILYNYSKKTNDEEHMEDDNKYESSILNNKVIGERGSTYPFGCQENVQRMSTFKICNAVINCEVAKCTNRTVISTCHTNNRDFPVDNFINNTIIKPFNSEGKSNKCKNNLQMNAPSSVLTNVAVKNNIVNHTCNVNEHTYDRGKGRNIQNILSHYNIIINSSYKNANDDKAINMCNDSSKNNCTNRRMQKKRSNGIRKKLPDIVDKNEEIILNKSLNTVMDDAKAINMQKKVKQREFKKEKVEFYEKLKYLPKITGVSYDRKQNLWVSHWRANCKTLHKYFSVKKYGFQNARLLAITCRNQNVRCTSLERGISHDASETLFTKLNEMNCANDGNISLGNIVNSPFPALENMPSDKNQSTKKKQKRRKKQSFTKFVSPWNNVENACRKQGKEGIDILNRYSQKFIVQGDIPQKIDDPNSANLNSGLLTPNEVDVEDHVRDIINPLLSYQCGSDAHSVERHRYLEEMLMGNEFILECPDKNESSEANYNKRKMHFTNLMNKKRNESVINGNRNGSNSIQNHQKEMETYEHLNMNAKREQNMNSNFMNNKEKIKNEKMDEAHDTRNKLINTELHNKLINNELYNKLINNQLSNDRIKNSNTYFNLINRNLYKSIINNKLNAQLEKSEHVAYKENENSYSNEHYKKGIPCQEVSFSINEEFLNNESAHYENIHNVYLTCDSNGNNHIINDTNKNNSNPTFNIDNSVRNSSAMVPIKYASNKFTVCVRNSEHTPNDYNVDSNDKKNNNSNTYDNSTSSNNNNSSSSNDLSIDMNLSGASGPTVQSYAEISDRNNFQELLNSQSCRGSMNTKCNRNFNDVETKEESYFIGNCEFTINNLNIESDKYLCSDNSIFLNNSLDDGKNSIDSNSQSREIDMCHTLLNNHKMKEPVNPYHNIETFISNLGNNNNKGLTHGQGAVANHMAIERKYSLPIRNNSKYSNRKSSKNSNKNSNGISNNKNKKNDSKQQNINSNNISNSNNNNNKNNVSNSNYSSTNNNVSNSYHENISKDYRNNISNGHHNSIYHGDMLRNGCIMLKGKSSSNSEIAVNEAFEHEHSINLENADRYAGRFDDGHKYKNRNNSNVESAIVQESYLLNDQIGNMVLERSCSAISQTEGEYDKNGEGNQETNQYNSLNQIEEEKKKLMISKITTKYILIDIKNKCLKNCSSNFLKNFPDIKNVINKHINKISEANSAHTMKPYIQLFSNLLEKRKLLHMLTPDAQEMYIYSLQNMPL
ncbi:transcription factor with AP2 domain(s) [Plasmodium gonderi]|uniref:Transcription factor with AP2 domain(S) n=1 Tax=Plasmodium gonderi TaxID=77519 RepID=A0A1Y1JMY4_PLAGO|nr:transcription factor with AP2 domain(s) [Plasmodium gonderi]GAW83600.1 transcription factor with AP2 domain(s) [Plasmodium gonderi]